MDLPTYKYKPTAQLAGPGGGLPGLPMFGQNFSSHFLTGLQTFASQVKYLQTVIGG